MNNEQLLPLGWNSFFDAELAKHGSTDLTVARISNEQRGSYTVLTAERELRGILAGTFYYATDDSSQLPAVGDWVLVRELEHEAKAVIVELLPRATVLSRKKPGSHTEEQIIAANLDYAVIIQGLDNDFNMKRLERYLAAAGRRGIDPVVVFSKADLCPDYETRRAAVQERLGTIPVLAVSAPLNLGFRQLREFCATGTTGAFIGSSGAGKSTIINILLGRPVQKTAAVREDDSRGRHTTTSRQLFRIPDGGLVIDTPGMRELQLWDRGDETAAGLGSASNDPFEDIVALARNCYYTDCRHDGEPGCAVREAIEREDLDPDHLKNYKKMEREAEFLRSRVDENEKLKRKEKEKKFQKEVRKIVRNKLR